MENNQSRPQKQKVSFWQLFIIVTVLVVLMPLPRFGCINDCIWEIPRLGCTDDCIWVIAPIFSTVALGGIFFISPFFIPSICYGIFYFILLWITSKVSWIRRTNIRWYTSVIIIALIGVFFINAYAINLNPDIRAAYTDLKSRYFTIHTIDIGMTRAEVLRLYPNALPDNPGYGAVEIKDFFIHRVGGFQDCLSIYESESKVYTCFKDGRVYVTFAPGRRQFFSGKGEIHDDYDSTLKQYSLTDPEVCEKIKHAPWYMGYPDIPQCYRSLAQTTGDDKYCFLASGSADNQCLANVGFATGRIEVCEKITLRERSLYDDVNIYYNDRATFDNCILYVADKQNNVSICDKMVSTDRKKFCQESIQNRQ